MRQANMCIDVNNKVSYRKRTRQKLTSGTLHFRPLFGGFPVINFRRHFGLIASLHHVTRQHFLRNNRLHLIRVIRGTICMNFRLNDIRRIRFIGLLRRRILTLTRPTFLQRVIRPLLRVPLLNTLRLRRLQRATILLPRISFTSFVIYNNGVGIMYFTLRNGTLYRRFLIRRFGETIHGRELLSFRRGLQSLRHFGVLPRLQICPG